MLEALSQFDCVLWRGRRVTRLCSGSLEAPLWKFVPGKDLQLKENEQEFSSPGAWESGRIPRTCSQLNLLQCGSLWEGVNRRH